MSKYIVSFLFSNPFNELTVVGQRDYKFECYSNNVYLTKGYKNNYFYNLNTREGNLVNIDQKNACSKIYNLYIEIDNGKYIIDGDNEILVNLKLLNETPYSSSFGEENINKSFEEIIRPQNKLMFENFESIYSQFYKKYPTKSRRELTHMASQELERRQRNTGAYDLRDFIENIYQIFLFLPKGVIYGIFSMIKGDEERILKITDIKSLFIFILEYFLINNPIDGIMFLFNSEYENNPFDIIITANRKICVPYKRGNLTYLILKTENGKLNVIIPPWTGVLNIEKQSKNLDKFFISGDALNYSVKCFNKQNLDFKNLNIEKWESGTYDYKTMILILTNIAAVSNTKYIIYKHNVMERDFALNMIIDDLLNANG
ncbi:MAG: hypothetical protein QW478_02655 [Candidatus Micrarchaeaceae archaeon]